MASTKTVLVTGDRRYDDRQGMALALRGAEGFLGPADRITLIHGAARGADSLAAECAPSSWRIIAVPARWEEHGPDCYPGCLSRRTCKRAGHRRNDEMLAMGPDLVLALPLHKQLLSPGEDRRLTSRGTWSMVDKAVAAGVPVLVAWGSPPTLFPADARALATTR